MTFDETQLQLLKTAILDLLEEVKDRDQKRQQTVSSAVLPNLPDEDLQSLLKVLLRDYQKKHDFKVGDLVRWKPGMTNRRFPVGDSPAIVIEVLTVPVMNPILDHGSPYFRELLDIRVGVPTFSGDLNTYLVESARFAPIGAK